MNDLFSKFFTAENLGLTSEFVHLICSFAFNSLFVWLIVHFFYYPKGHRRDYYFTFMLLSVSIFMLVYVLLKDASGMGIGAALGLFAIFGIIRYRTESVPIREMTYLFFLVALSVLNAKAGEVGYAGHLLINSIFLIVVWACENFLSAHKEGCKFVKYDNIDLIQPEKYEELKADLSQRLGLEITRIEVGSVDFLKDMAMLRVFYRDPEMRIKDVDRLFKIPRDNAF